MIRYQYIVEVAHASHQGGEGHTEYFGPFPTEDGADSWAYQNYQEWETLTLEEAS